MSCQSSCIAFDTVWNSCASPHRGTSTTKCVCAPKPAQAVEQLNICATCSTTGASPASLYQSWAMLCSLYDIEVGMGGDGQGTDKMLNMPVPSLVSMYSQDILPHLSTTAASVQATANFAVAAITSVASSSATPSMMTNIMPAKASATLSTAATAATGTAHTEMAPLALIAAFAAGSCLFTKRRW